MSKELEAWQQVKDYLEFSLDRKTYCEAMRYTSTYDYLKPFIETVETALKNYEELTNKPVILYGRTHGQTKALIDMISKNYKEIKITNLDDEEKLKAFEIIKEKKVDISYLIICIEQNVEPLQFYNEIAKDLHNGELTQEEYELLKKVLL